MKSPTVQDEPTSSPPLTFYQGALLGLLGLLATTCGTLVFSAWHAVDEFAAQEAARRSDQLDFHAKLVTSLQGLAEKSGMLTSADLCPVRFRFRLQGSPEPPAHAVHVFLQSDDNGWQLVDVFTNSAGTAEFGLVPPGEYRMTATMYDGYSLEHAFTVLPGVPVDRLVVCPSSSNADLHTALRVEWPESLRDRPLYALCEVERDDVRAGEFAWAPLDRDGLLVMCRAGNLATRDIDDLAGLSQETAEPDTDLVTSIPLRFCRLSRIHIWQVGSDGGPPTELATFAYRADESVIAACPSDIALQAPCPRYEASPNSPTDDWVVTLPPEAEAALLRLLALDAEASNLPPALPAADCEGAAMPSVGDWRAGADPSARIIDFRRAGDRPMTPATGRE